MYLLTKFKFDAQREIYDDFPKVTCWDVIRDLTKTIMSLDHNSENIAIQDMKFGSEDHHNFGSNGFFF